jgi:hypothetical protein
VCTPAGGWKLAVHHPVPTDVISSPAVVPAWVRLTVKLID